MNDIQRILCPVDFSETSDLAFAAADRLAHRLGAELLLLHAFDGNSSLSRSSQAARQKRGKSNSKRLHHSSRFTGKWALMTDCYRAVKAAARQS